ncbi:hypothetical protein RHIZ404_230426 [Rhizobium sp. EC-SD404]|nr:hypothetical protein RHIZ404_230426 [Rhizobium sp. EC-SD404]
MQNDFLAQAADSDGVFELRDGRIKEK